MARDGLLARLQAPNLDAAAELCADAIAHARAVPVLVEVGDYSGAVLLTYEMARKLALGLLLADGWRTAGGEGEHRITFEAAVLLLAGRASVTLKDAGYLRRHPTAYSSATKANSRACCSADHGAPRCPGTRQHPQRGTTGI
jgi:hypothetical protein